MKRSITFLPFLILVICLAAACKKQTDNTPSYAPVSDFMNMRVGKYVRYRLDSTLFVFYGQNDSTISYQAKDLVEEAFTDNTGRPSWRVVRYLRDTASINENDWVAAVTYYITADVKSKGGQTIEVVENNLRYEKLKSPIWDGFTWAGNAHLPSSTFSTYVFSNDDYMQLWEYAYQDIGATETLNGQTYDSTISVLQVDDSQNVPITIPEGIAYRNYWIEKYAKNVGLIYKEVVMWEYQPANGANPTSIRTGFGLKMSIIDHN